MNANELNIKLKKDLEKLNDILFRIRELNGNGAFLVDDLITWREIQIKYELKNEESNIESNDKIIEW